MKASQVGMLPSAATLKERPAKDYEAKSPSVFLLISCES